MPAEQVWADGGSLGRWLDRPQELLLAELGRASRIYPDLADGLREAQPCALDLDADGAHRLPDRAAPMLDEAGFGVLLPRGGTGGAGSGSPRPRDTPADGVVTKPGKFGRDQLVDFRWRLAVGDEALERGRDRRARRERRRRWCGCAASGWRSTPSSCGAAWSSCAREQVGPG